ncbi:MAG: hypothetical protein WBA83_17870 [Burkholderiaceae bacterium]
MSLIVAARFDTFDAARGAASVLLKEGVAADALHTFFVNPAGAHDLYALGGDRAVDPHSRGGQYGAVGGAAAVGIVGALVGAVVAFTLSTSFLIVVVGAGAGAYIGSLAGAMYVVGKSRPPRGPRAAADASADGVRASGVLLAVHVSPEQEKKVARMLKDAGGQEVERAQGRWGEEGWQDFDPLVSPRLEKDL